MYGGLDAQLARLGLRRHVVDADGNCFFRSLADQLSSDDGSWLDEPERHTNGEEVPPSYGGLRRRIVKYMREHRDMFEPFVEDDEAFDDYIERMEAEGTWAGHLEVQAAALVLGRNIVLHQDGEPVWIVQSSLEGEDDGCGQKTRNSSKSEKEATMSSPLHLAYSDGMHYDSVRLLSDTGAGPIAPIPSLQDLRGAARLGADGSNPSDASEALECEDRAIIQVQQDSGVWNESKARYALSKSCGNVAEAVDLLTQSFVIDALEGFDASNETEEAKSSSPSNSEIKSGISETENHATLDLSFSTTAPLDASSRSSSARTDLSEAAVKVRCIVRETPEESTVVISIVPRSKTINHDATFYEEAAEEVEKEPLTKLAARDGRSATKANAKSVGRGSDAGKSYRRNAKCPCGSKRKYKNCCGTAASRGKLDRDRSCRCEDDGASSVVHELQALYI